MNLKFSLGGLALPVMLLISQIANAEDFPPPPSTLDATLTFTEPTGTVSPTDTIEVWATLSLSAMSAAITYNPFELNFGLPDYLLPTTGTDWNNNAFDVPFVSYTDAVLFISNLCDGTFAGCSDGEYNRNFSNSTWFSMEYPFTLNAGESRDFLLYEFIPKDGSAQPGEYSFYSTSVGISVTGLDANGNTLEADALEIMTCPFGYSDQCAFTRTVSAVPVPAAIWLFGPAIFGLLSFFRQSKLKVS